jgi:hypothetical protein
MRVFRHTIATWLLLVVNSVVCLAQTLPLTSPESAAKVINLTGQVSVLKDSNPWALQVGSTIRLQEMIVTGSDGFATFQVSDGSTFEVFPNSRVTFRNNPANWKDLLDLWIGRVKVHIEKIGGQPNNNRVKAPTAVISVRGTIFDVQADDEDMTLVSVEEGQVAVQHALFYSQPKLLNPGEYIRVYRNQPLADKTIDKSKGIQQGLRAAAEAFYRIIYRNPQVPAGGSPGVTGGTSGGGPVGDIDNSKKPPSPGAGGSTGTTTAPAPAPPPPVPPH